MPQKKYIRDLSEITATQKKEKLATIKGLQDDIRELNEANAKVSVDVAESEVVTTEIVSNQKKLQDLNEFAAGFRSQQKGCCQTGKVL